MGKTNACQRNIYPKKASVQTSLFDLAVDERSSQKDSTELWLLIVISIKHPLYIFQKSDYFFDIRQLGDGINLHKTNLSFFVENDVCPL